MESNHSDGFVDDETSKQLNSSPYLNGINGEPEILPRVGDEYQADIPVLVSEHDRLNLVKWFKSENLITFGLPIPLMWTRSEKFKGTFLEYEKTSPLSDEPEREPEPPRKRNRRSVVLALPCQRNVKLKFNWPDNVLYPFPGTLGESWEASEKERFLLALYCLGKNLVSVQRFVGSKKMGDMLSYYYGSFYRSNEYRRWEEGRKSRTRRSSVQGQKLFTGWRLQELLSRISSNVSEERKSMLLKVSKEFREEKITIEEFVFTLKEAVGIDLFTEAIGIGKGKKDLTNSAVEPTTKNSSEAVRIRNDLPVSDIVKFLTGEYRMSKTKSCDLFWEAVWPRLLARGWHSEQPKDGPRNSLVFLIPEANKFSRRKMSKGTHYFDSLTDVLNRVRLDPKLLELKTDEQERGEEEIIKVEETPEFGDPSPNGKRKKRYLQPRSKQPSKSSQEVTMFTIMDTSNANGTLKELRSLPVEIRSSVSESEDNNLSEESENNKVETTRAPRVCGGGGSISSGKSMDNATSRSTISLNERQEKPKKNKGGRPRNPVFAKRSSLLADCTLREESGCFGETQFQKKKKKKKPNPSEEADDDQNERIDQDQTLKLSSEDDSLCRRKQEERRISSSSQEPERRPEKTREDFDLNVSQIEHEADGDDTVTVITTEVVQNSERSCVEQSSVQMDVEKQQVTADLLPEPRRQSTRARPLTTKALEAIAFGYLGNSKKKKRKDSEEESRSNKSRTKRIHRNHSVVLSSEFRNGIVEDGSNTDDDE